MTPLGHASISFLAGFAATKIIPQLNPSLILLATTTGGVAPDLDLLYRYIKTGGKNILDKKIGKHRYLPSHTPFFTFLVSIPLIFINLYFGIFFFLGTLIHLLLDTLFFPEGVNFMYPFRKRMTRFFYIKTHSFWAPKEISGITNWHINYLTSPLFWVSEIIPTILAFIVLFGIITK